MEDEEEIMPGLGKRKKIGSNQPPKRFNSLTIEIPEYNYKSDLTLTQNQVKNKGGAFQTTNKKGEIKYRLASNKTQNFDNSNKQIRSGYHEAFLITSEFMKGSKNENEKIVFEISDGFRTDTAQTILSAQNGKIAGHSGSGLSQENQKNAHDLLRSVTDQISNDHRTLSPGVINVIGSAITVASIAPGILARTIKGGTSSLKAGKKAKNNWEINRETAKNRTVDLFNQLTKVNKEIVLEYVKCYFDEINPTGSTPRLLAGKLPVSPRRNNILSNVKYEVQGGQYLGNSSKFTFENPKSTLKPNSEFVGHYVTQPFRADRRTSP